MIHGSHTPPPKKRQATSGHILGGSENWFRFAKFMTKSCASCFLGHSVQHKQYTVKKLDPSTHLALPRPHCLLQWEPQQQKREPCRRLQSWTMSTLATSSCRRSRDQAGWECLATSLWSLHATQHIGSHVIQCINEVILCRDWSVLGWATIFRWAYHLDIINSQLHQLNLHPSRVSKSSISFTEMGRNVTCVGWHITLCDSIWHVSYCSSEASCIMHTATIPFTYLLIAWYRFQANSMDWI